jgi:hypothetical protein
MCRRFAPRPMLDRSGRFNERLRLRRVHDFSCILQPTTEIGDLRGTLVWHRQEVGRK